MNTDTCIRYGNKAREDHRHKTRAGRPSLSRNPGERHQDFKCGRCHNHVSAEPFISGVQNRNHCPYCLWSRHVDLHKAGDRLAACKGQMEPIGLTLKQIHKKYASPDDGELMLIHRCLECGKVSINRIAADDVPEALFDVFKASLERVDPDLAALAENGIQALAFQDTGLVRARLFGGYDLPETSWDDFLNSEPLLEIFDLD
jgi:DNA-directed RNA polymerase subunit RPC12/RpoP